MHVCMYVCMHVCMYVCIKWSYYGIFHKLNVIERSF